MLVSPKTRYQMSYDNLDQILTDVLNHRYQISGFGRVSPGDWYLQRNGGPGNPDFEQWHQPFKSTGAYIKLIKIG